MPNKKYKLDPESLKYHEVDSKRQKFLKALLTQVVATIFIAGILYIGFSYFIETSEQKKLKRENKKLEEQYKYLNNKYQQTEKVINELIERDKNIYRAIFESEPPGSSDNKIDFSLYDSLSNADLVKINSLHLTNVLRNSKKSKKLYKDILSDIPEDIESLQKIPAIQPIPNKDLKQVIYGYGKRIDPVYKTPVFHSGVDFAAPIGTQVYATADGKVTQANQRIRGLGKHIEINHGNDFITIYAHLSEMTVHYGEKVKRGQIIGYVGNSGKSLVSHLHYEVHFKNEPVNPIHFFFLELSPEKYSKIIKASSRGGISLD